MAFLYYNKRNKINAKETGMKIKLSKNQWEFVGRKAGWMGKQAEQGDGDRHTIESEPATVGLKPETKPPELMTPEELRSSGYIPVWRGTDEHGFSSIMATEGGALGSGVDFYTEPFPARSHATGEGGVIAGWVPLSKLQLKGLDRNIVHIDDISDFIPKGRVRNKDTFDKQSYLSKAEIATGEKSGYVREGDRYVFKDETKPEPRLDPTRENKTNAKETGMKIKLSKNQWEFVGRKAGWMGKQAEQGDHIIAESFGGKVVINERAKGSEENNNFIIICDHGDWSGFMPLREALRKLDQLSTKSPDKYYAVVER
jgi:hypothetical protein